MKTIDDFIKQHELTADVVPVPENPYMMDPMPGMRHYHVTIHKPGEGNSIGTFYSVGRCFTNNDTEQQIIHKPATLYEQEENDRVIAKYGIPKLRDVLDTLALNAASLDATDFEEWAEMLDFDTDSRRAEWTYNVTRREVAALRKFLGMQSFNELRDGVYRIGEENNG